MGLQQILFQEIKPWRNFNWACRISGKFLYFSHSRYSLWNVLKGCCLNLNGQTSGKTIDLSVHWYIKDSCRFQNKGSPVNLPPSPPPPRLSYVPFGPNLVGQQCNEVYTYGPGCSKNGTDNCIQWIKYIPTKYILSVDSNLSAGSYFFDRMNNWACCLVFYLLGSPEWMYQNNNYGSVKYVMRVYIGEYHCRLVLSLDC